jgi:hypothetical protein
MGFLHSDICYDVVRLEGLFRLKDHLNRFEKAIMVPVSNLYQEQIGQILIDIIEHLSSEFLRLCGRLALHAHGRPAGLWHLKTPCALPSFVWIIDRDESGRRYNCQFRSENSKGPLTRPQEPSLGRLDWGQFQAEERGAKTAILPDAKGNV